MRIILSSLVLLVCSIYSPHAETFSSSTNFVQTLRIGTNEAIFISTLKVAPDTVLMCKVYRSNQVEVLPLPTLPFSRPIAAFAGPMDLQFQEDNVLMEFQRIQTTNVFTAVYGTNGHTISVPADNAYSGGCRTVIPISVGQGSDLCRTPFRFISDSVPG